jgi:hypothetical protein
LASILVSGAADFTIASLDDAIQANMRICVDQPAAQILLAQNPAFGKSGLAVEVQVRGAWRAVKARKCDAVIAEQSRFKEEVMDGYANTFDCDAEKAGTLSKEEAYCERSSATGEPVKNRDCGFGQVGEVLASAPVAWAVSPYLPGEVIHALSWAIRNQLDKGALVKAKSLFAETSPSECMEPESKASLDGLDISAMFGSAIGSGCCMIVGILIAITQRLHRRTYLTSKQSEQITEGPKQEPHSPHPTHVRLSRFRCARPQATLPTGRKEDSDRANTSHSLSGRYSPGNVTIHPLRSHEILQQICDLIEAGHQNTINEPDRNSSSALPCTNQQPLGDAIATHGSDGVLLADARMIVI